MTSILMYLSRFSNLRTYFDNRSVPEWLYSANDVILLTSSQLTTLRTHVWKESPSVVVSTFEMHNKPKLIAIFIQQLCCKLTTSICLVGVEYSLLNYTHLSHTEKSRYIHIRQETRYNSHSWYPSMDLHWLCLIAVIYLELIYFYCLFFHCRLIE